MPKIIDWEPNKDEAFYEPRFKKAERLLDRLLEAAVNYKLGKLDDLHFILEAKEIVKDWCSFEQK